MDSLELSAADRDRLLVLVKKHLPHLLDEPGRIDWYITECLSYWRGRGRGAGAGRRDWPMTILNRMLRVEDQRFRGAIPDPARVRNDQAERALAEAAVKNAERGVDRGDAIAARSGLRLREVN
jgi:hypothetical protein